MDSIHYEEIKLFGENIERVYDYDLNTAYEFINKNTSYLKNIPIEKVKDIKFSCYKDIVILLTNGTLISNGEEIFNDIKTLGLSEGMYVFSISNDNIINSLTGNWKTTKLLNNNNYKYKKIVITKLGMAALTYENTVKFFGLVVDGLIDYENFCDVEDIGYVSNDDDIVVIKNGNVISLFNNDDYKKEDVLLEGSNEDFIIV